MVRGTRMESKKVNFEIRPIFNQNDSIWRDFTRIEMTSESVKYGYVLNAEDERRIMFSHRQEWNRGKYKFAFGAYHDGEMVGFVNGYLLDRNTMYLRNLFVLPEFSGNGAGSQLLNGAERTSLLVAREMDVVSLHGAASFYAKNGYRVCDGRSMYKDLKKSSTGVVPAFEWHTSRRAKLTFDVDVKFLSKEKYQPKFIYLNLNQEIEAVALRSHENEDIIWVNPNKAKAMADFYQNIMKNTLAKLR